MNQQRRLTTGVNPNMVGGSSLPIPPAPAPAVGSPGRGQEVTLLQFRPSNTVSQDGQEQAIAPEMMVATVVGQNGSGPLVGLARWGSGRAGLFQMEFDIPLPGFVAGNVAPLGGSMLAVPCEVLEIAVRNDANLKTRAQDSPIGNVGLGVPQAYAALGLGNRKSSRLYRTVFGVFNNPTVAPGGGLVDAGTVTFAVPAFATEYQLFRTPGSGANACHVGWQVNDVGGTTIDGPYDLAAGVSSPLMPLPITAGAVTVQNRDGGGGVLQIVGCVFTLSP